MKLEPTAQRVSTAIKDIPVIDCHEHLPPESQQLKTPVDVFTLFAHYTKTDFLSAGMSADDYERMVDPTVDLDKRWKQYSPFIKHIRHGSYARPAYLAASDLYGENGIHDGNYRALSEKMQDAHRPGLYEEFLRRRCGIQASVTQGGRAADFDTGLFRVVSRVLQFTGFGSRGGLEANCRALGSDPDSSLKGYLAAIQAWMKKEAADGAVGFKLCARPHLRTPKKQARAALKKIRDSRKKPSPREIQGLQSFLTEEVLQTATRLDLPVAVHAGMWGDFRFLDANHWIPIFQRFPETRFELYHLSMPNIRDAIVIGKNFPNVWLNLCWCHIISQRWSLAAIDEILDLVPINKVFAFGGDYGRPYMKVYGHLQMAIENVAAVFGRRVDNGNFDEEEALRIARLWFHDNPKAFYRL
jgi:predicted TIM-barrel fold metal-dependent hydrolase